jgi:RND family efflux transporter MFP subunit
MIENMYLKIFMVAVFALFLMACNPKKNAQEVEPEGHEHSGETEQSEEHEEVKFQYTAYSSDFELFAEADAFVVGETANVLSHFSVLPEFKAVETGKITLVLMVNGNETRQSLDKPTRKGIYSFDIQPGTAGAGTLKFEIINEKGNFEVVVPEVTVFAEHEEAHEAAEAIIIPKTNTTVFTKEQSWKIDYSTDFPGMGPFGQVIKTTARVESSQDDEIIISAKTNGIVLLPNNKLLEGKTVSAGQVLFSVSSSELADNNLSVKYAEAKSNFEKAQSDYERAEELAKDKIVSEKDLLGTKNKYDVAKAVYDNLNKNFNTTGQMVSSPMNGFIKQFFIKNGAYVEAGQPIVTISQNKTLMLGAEVQQKYAPLLGSVKSANIRTLHDNQTYTLEQLNGYMLSYGKAANSDNYLIPVKLQIDNNDSFIQGGFVELYLKTETGTQALSVANTALMEDQGTYFVYVQITPELFEKREVKIGVSDGLSTEIVQGLSATERIVTRGAILIKLAQATGALDAHSGHVH